MPISFPSASSSSRPQPPSPASSSSSLPSYASSEGTIDREEQSALIQEEWEESLRQMEVVFSIIIMPYFGKWFGRRWSYWAYARYEKLGLTKAFFGLIG